MDSSILELLLNEAEDEKDIAHTINSQSFIIVINREIHAFLCNFGNALHSEWAKIAFAMLVQLLSPAPSAIIPILISTSNHTE